MAYRIGAERVFVLPHLARRKRAARAGPRAAWRRVGLVACLLALLGLSLAIPAATAPAAQEARLQLFDRVWEQVARLYLDARLHGVDWEGVRAKYRPRVAAARDDAEAYALINEALATLKDPGTFVLSPQEVKEMRQQGAGVRVVGVGMLLGGMPSGDILVRQVVPGGPASRAGVRPGDRVVQVDGRPVKGLPVDQVAQMIRGPEGTRVKLVLRRPDGSEKQVQPKRAEVHFEPKVRSEMLAGQIGYLAIPTYGEGMENQVLAHLRRLHKSRGLILDLRNSLGGGPMLTLQRIAGLFTDKPLGALLSRQGVALLTPEKTWEPPNWWTGLLTPPPTALDRYDKPLVVLIDDTTLLDILALGLKEGQGAQLVGRPTSPGRGSSQLSIDLPGGGQLSVTVGAYVSPAGHTLRNGIRPDVLVAMDDAYVASWGAGQDPDVARGLAVLQAKLGNPAAKAPAAL